MYRQSMPPVSIAHLFPVERKAIPTLRHLTLFNDPIRHNYLVFPYVSCLYACAANTATVAVRDIPLHALETFILSSNTFSGSIRELSIVLVSPTPGPSFIMPHVREMYLEQEHIDALLSHCPNLRVLEIDIKQESFEPVQLPAPSSPHPQIEVLRFTYRGLHNLYAESLPPPAWDDWALSSSRIRSVSFTFVVPDGPDSEWGERLGELVKGLFLRMHSAAKLEWRVEHGLHA
ncbi:hypothetical protein AURDEDRAFT_188185 [Auricularia subglabra TFB-10046 SS5]|uniref:F-box domain-containing protein n=1 Tax=Auricularia subglabra (strain TFB-10046 / SS5) TaxID=717982 RepID=J0LGS1_AURST|nr:hypothetical protein AURDEDRAFT_188185 [Auricularia subglabra TFB-10046 SS5]